MELIFSAFDADGNDLTQSVRDALSDTKKLCDLITGSDSSTPIKGKIESIAFELGNHEMVINAL